MMYGYLRSIEDCRQMENHLVHNLRPEIFGLLWYKK